MVNYTIKTIRNTKYVYSQQTIDGKQKETYMGRYENPEVRALLEPKITKIQNEPQGNLEIYKKQVLANIRELKTLLHFGSIDEIREKLSQLESELVKEVQQVDSKIQPKETIKITKITKPKKKPESKNTKKEDELLKDLNKAFSSIFK